jgi:Eco57I restriction-modification methylase
LNYIFHSFTGNTLELNVDVFFDAVIGNPPYNKSKEVPVKGGYGGRSLWDKFVVKSLDSFLVDKGY